MNNVNSYDYILIGILIRLLANVTEYDEKSFVTGELIKLKQMLDQVGFQVCCSNFNTTFFEALETNLVQLEDNSRIGPEVIGLLRKEMVVLERHVLSEGLTKFVHVLPERRYNSKYLLSEQDKLFKVGIFGKLPHLAQTDLISSCRCLLFGEATASAFHILRATEDVLKSYYMVHIKTKRLARPMWAAMVTALKNKTKNKPPEALLNALDLIRVAYRNPTQHPDAVYEVDSVQDLFGVCIDVIGKMGSEL